MAVAAPDSKANPFYFIIFPKNDVYKVYGEGTGDKTVTDKVYAELIKLTPSEIRELIEGTKRAPASP